MLARYYLIVIRQLKIMEKVIDILNFQLHNIEINYTYVHFVLDSPYYYYYNERFKDVKCIKCSKNSLEYFNDHHRATSTIVM